MEGEIFGSNAWKPKAGGLDHLQIHALEKVVSCAVATVSFAGDGMKNVSQLRMIRLMKGRLNSKQRVVT